MITIRHIALIMLGVPTGAAFFAIGYSLPLLGQFLFTNWIISPLWAKILAIMWILAVSGVTLYGYDEEKRHV